jgi:hypothetical protein
MHKRRNALILHRQTRSVPRTWYCSNASETCANGLLVPPVGWIEPPKPEELVPVEGRDGELVLLLADNDDAFRGRDDEKS